jgi:hypothetical protein
VDKFIAKEQRDALRWAPLGAGLLTLLLVYVFRNLEFLSFHKPLSRDIYGYTWFASAVFACLLSVATFWKDASDSGRAFLIHRGLSPSRIFHVRVATCLVVYLISMLLPLMGAAVYVASIGPDRAPVRPIQVLPSVPVVFYGMAFYFAGVIVSCRPSRWFGSKLLPLITAVPISMAAEGFSEMNWAFILISQSLGIVGMACLFFASRFAFVRLPCELSPSRQASQSFSLRATLVVACVLGVPAIAIPISAFLSPSVMRNLHVQFTSSGDPWLVSQSREEYSFDDHGTFISQSKSSRSDREQIAMNASNSGSEGLALDRRDDSSLPLRSGRLLKPIASINHSLDMTYLDAKENHRFFIDPTGYILVYEAFSDRTMQLQWVVGADSVTRPLEARGTPFSSVPCQLNLWMRTMVRSAQRLFIFATREAIYEVDFESATIQTRIPGPIDFVCESDMRLFNTATSSPFDQQMIIISGNELVLYETLFHEVKPEEQVPSSDKSKSLTIRETSRSSIGDSKLPKVNGSPSLHFFDTENWTIALRTMPSEGHDFVIRRSEQSKVSELTFKAPARMRPVHNRLESAAVMSSVPPIYMGLACLIFGLSAGPFSFPGDIILLVSQSIGSSLLCFVTARSRGLTTAGQFKWAVAGCLLGLGTCLGILANCPKPIRVACLECGRKRRVENDCCEHCNAGWQGPQFGEIAIREESISQTASRAIEPSSIS